MSKLYRVAVIVLVVAAVGVGAFFAGRVTAPPSSSALPRCEATHLRVVQSGTGGAAGTIERTFSLQNAGSAACTLDGYPGLLLLGRGGSAEPTKVVRGGGLAFEDIAPSTVELEPGATAYVNVGYSDVMPPCSLATAVQITLPGGSAYEVATVAPTMRVCDNGTLHVSAVFGSTDTTATRTTAPAST